MPQNHQNTKKTQMIIEKTATKAQSHKDTRRNLFETSCLGVFVAKK